MPIFDQDTHIFIAHRTVGNSPTTQQLGEMSLELAIYLEAKLLEHTLTKELNGQNGTDSAMFIGAANFLNNPSIRENIVRAINAGNRGYKPQLCSEFGKLSPAGLELAKVARQVIAEINNASEESGGPNDFAYNPDKWVRADEVIINATIPKRALRFLDKMTDAIDAVESGHAAQKMQEMAKATLKANLADPTGQFGDSMALPVNSVKQTNSTNSTNSADSTDTPKQTNSEFSGLIDLMDIRLKSEVNTSVIKPELLPVSAVTGEHQAFVPTAPFGQRARTDVSYLLRYGLLDIKAYLAGNRGRPKHVIRTSVPGRRILNDLRRLDVI